MDDSRHFGFLLKDISRLTTLNFAREAGEFKLTMAQCKVLIYLERHEGASQARLAYLTDTDPMALVRILDRMEADGWIERRPDPDDRRARQLYLTKAAAPVIDEVWRIADRARAASLAGLSAADRTQLVTLLGRVHQNLSALVGNVDSNASKRPQKAGEKKPAAKKQAAANKKKASR
ncbi:MAG: MarR family transcriptional regulator [Rhizobium sp.]|nr:MAG: MarR family transcriptional regulator [Rhizobium sp.]